MGSYAFDRLSAEENRFLLLEGPNTPMHVTTVSILRTGSLRTPSGGVDIRTYKKYVAALLNRVPRYRRKLKRIPIAGEPVWVDDPHFNLDYHVRHSALPRPGTLDELKKKAARIMVQPLDPRRPLWETWVVEHLEGDRFALIDKLHLSMLDSIERIDLAQVSMSTSPRQKIPSAPAYLPRPEPSGWELYGGEWRRRLSSHPLERLRKFRDQSAGVLDEIQARARAVANWIGAFRSGIEETPLNGTVGPHRRFDWLTMSLADLKELRKSLSCTLNDVILLIVTGAVRRFLLHRHVEPSEIRFRVTAPISVHAEDPDGAPTSDVHPWMIELPIGQPDPMEQLEALHTETAALKESLQALGAETMSAVAEWTASTLFTRAARTLARPLPVHLTITNVPGAQQALYLLGAEQLEWYGAFPLMEHTGLGVSIVSYNGRMCWGFNADWALVPDLAQFAKGVIASLAELSQVSGVAIKGLRPEPASSS